MIHSFKSPGKLRFQEFRILLEQNNDKRMEGNRWIRVSLITKINARSINAKRGLTSRVMMKVNRLSLTFRKDSGSATGCKASWMAVVRRVTRASHSSSTSRSDRKFPVVSSTWDSTMKKPEISCVRDWSETRGRGVGRIRSDCAYRLSLWHILRENRENRLLFCLLGMISEAHSRSSVWCRCEYTQKVVWNQHGAFRYPIHRLYRLGIRVNI